jgi:signal peptidase
MQFNKDTLYLITQVMNNRGWIDLPAQGTSMYPFIKKGDICRFISCKASNIKKGDIILYRTDSGSLVAHRFYKLKHNNQQIQYIFKGDTNLGYDEPVNQDQILGKLMTDFSAHIWSQIIITFPILSKILRVYLNRKESTQAGRDF